MVERIVNLVGQLGHWGYLVIFLLVTGESALFLGFVLPGETVVVLGGFLANQGVLDLGDLLVLVSAAAVLGDTIGFGLGRRFGGDWLVRHGRWVGLRQRHLKHAEDFFARHGGKTVFLGRFSAFLRATVPFIAGASGMGYLRFFFYNALGGVLWAVGFVMLGYLVGASWRVVDRWIGRAGALVGAAIVLGLVLAWAGRWLVRHEAELRRGWAALVAWPRVAALRRRLAPLIYFLQARLTPGGYLGLRLTVGAAVLIAALWIFGAIVQDIVAGDPLTRVGNALAAWLEAHSTPTATGIMTGISGLAGPVTVAIASSLVGVILVMSRRWYLLLELILVVPGGILLAQLTGWFFREVVAPLAMARTRAIVYSFPSQHTVMAVLLYGVLAAMTVRAVRRWHWRVNIALGAFVVVLLVGFSRLYLGAAFLSDVLGAAAEGVAWLAFCLTGVRMLRVRSAARTSD